MHTTLTRRRPMWVGTILTLGIWVAAACSSSDGLPTAQTESDSSTGTQGSESGQTTGSQDPTDPDPSGDTQDATTSDTADTSTTDPSGADSTGDTGGSTGGANTCDGQQRCIAVAPAGWEGPVAIRDVLSDTHPECGGSVYTTVVAALQRELDEGQLTCDCECGSAQDLVCGSTTVLRRYATDTCNPALNIPTWTVSGSCNTTVDGPGLANWRAEPVPVISGECPPVDLSTHEEASHLRRATLCSGRYEQLDCESNEVCAPVPAPPFDEEWCVFQAGNVPCPAEYNNKTLYYGGITDSRTCSPCSCDSPVGECTGYGVALFSGPNCDDFGTGTVPATNACFESINLDTDSARIALGQPPPDAPCAPLGGEAAGQIQEDDATTVCCRPPA